MLVATDAGTSLFLNILFGASSKLTAFTLELFTDTLPISDSDTTSTHTVAAGGGYTAKTFYPDAAVALSGGVSQAVWDPITFEFSGILTGNPSIYGYRVVSSGTLLWQELLETAFTPENLGDALTIVPRFKLGNGSPE